MALIAAGAVLGAAAIGGAASYFGQQSANAANEQAADVAWERSREAYQNRYLWQMQDMERAGLNPILAYQNPPPGGPAGVPYSAKSAAGAGVEGAARGVTSALAARRLGQEISNMKAVEERDKAQAYAALEAGAASGAVKDRAIQETRNLMYEEILRGQQIDITDAQVKAALADEELLSRYPNIRKLGTILRELGMGGAGTAVVGAGAGGLGGYYSSRALRNMKSKTGSGKYGRALPGASREADGRIPGTPYKSERAAHKAAARARERQKQRRKK